MKQNKDTVRLTFVGDLLCQADMRKSYETEANTYDFTPVFENIRKYLKDADYVIGNLETPIAGKDLQYVGTDGKFKGGFNAPEAYLQAVVDSGFNLLTTANNHCMDRGLDGLKQTIDALESAGIDHIGTYKNPNEKNRPFIKEINGVKIAFLTYTFGINNNVHPSYAKEIEADYINLLSRPEMQKYEDYWHTFPSIHRLWPPKFLRKVLMKDDFLHDADSISKQIITDIQQSKEAGAEIVVLIPHMGVEFTRYPLKFARDMVNVWFDAGADIIIGGHPHVLQPMEFRKIQDNSGINRTGYVIYSLGNFAANGDSYWPTKECYTSIILNLIIERDEHSHIPYVKDISYTPTIIHTIEIDNIKKSFTISIIDLYKQAVDDNNDRLCKELIEANSRLLSDLHWGKVPASDIKEYYSFTMDENAEPHRVSRISDLKYTVSRLPHLFFRILRPVFKLISPIYHKIRG